MVTCSHSQRSAPSAFRPPLSRSGAFVGAAAAQPPVLAVAFACLLLPAASCAAPRPTARLDWGQRMDAGGGWKFCWQSGIKRRKRLF